MPVSYPHREAIRRRAVQLLLMAVMAAAFIGFFTGVGYEHRPAQEPPRPPARPAAPYAVPAMAYGVFDRREFGPNREWRSVLTDVQQRDAPARLQWQQPSQQEVRLSVRATRRAFDGAPPTVPHPIEQMSSTECLACHAQARYVGKQVYAPAMSHEMLPNCTQCHIEQDSSAFDLPRAVANTFEGTIRPTPGDRAWSAAPPSVPHSLIMRENCMSCHGPAGAHAIRADHPWDAVCLQCHTPAIPWVARTQFARPDTMRRLGILPPEPASAGDEGR